MLAAMSDDPTVIRASRLVDVVSGEVLTGRAVVVRGDQIESVVVAEDAPTEADVIDLSGWTVLPGLIDCHAHMIGEVESGHGYAGLVTRTAAQEAFSGVRNARDTVMAGFTTVRDVGTFRAFVDVVLSALAFAFLAPVGPIRATGDDGRYGDRHVVHDGASLAGHG